MRLVAALFALFVCRLGFCVAPVASTTFTGGEQGRILVQVRINGHGPFLFLFDTGSMNIISRALADRLGIPVAGQSQLAAFGGTITTGSAVLDSVNVGDLTMRQTQAVVIDGGPFSPQALAGVLGREFLSQLVVRVDYEHGSLQFFDPSSFTYDGRGVRVALGRSPSQAITIPATVFGATAELQVDSGSEAGLVLFPRFVRARNLHRGVEATTGYGFGGPTRAMVTRAPEVQIGRLTIKRAIVQLSLDSTGIEAGEEDGNLGGPLLREFTWIFDVPHKAAYLEPNAWFGKPEESDKSGLVVDSRGNSARVLFVYPHSPAANAGIAPGDELTGANGESLSSDQWHDLLDGTSGSKVVVTVRHQTHRRRVQIELRPYL